MAVGYRSSSATGASDAQDAGKSIAVPAGAAAGDVALIAIEIWLDTSTDPVVTWPAGFTQKIYYESTTDGFQRVLVAWKRLTGADSGTYTYTISGSYWNMAHCILLTGAVTVGDPIETTDTQQAAATSSIPTNSLTTATIPGLVQFVANENASSQTPRASYTEVQDGDYIHTSYFLPGSSGTQTASGGSLSVSNAVILAALLAIIPDAPAGAASADPSPTWFPGFMAGTAFPPFMLTAVDPVNPVSLSYDLGSSTAAASGVTTATQRSEVDSAGSRQAVSASTAPQRTATVSTGSKGSASTSTASARTALTATGRKGTSSAAAVYQRSVDATGATRQTAGGGAAPQRSMAVSTGTGVAPRDAILLQRSAVTSTGVKSSVVAAVVACRTASATGGRRQGIGSGQVPARPFLVATGVHRGSGTASVSSRLVATGLGARKAAGSASCHTRVVAAAGFAAPVTAGTATGAVGPVPTASGASGVAPTAKTASMTVPTATGG